MRVILGCYLVAYFLGATPASAAPPIYGLGQAKDGDSLMVGDKEVRLFGIDAPEFDQTCKRGGQDWGCGSAAADELMKLVTGKQVRCDSMGVDQHHRILGRCSVGTTDINRTMVSLGHAVAYRHYSSDYVSAEESAKATKRGLWAGTFEMPSDYRHSGEVQAEPGRPMKTKRVASSDWQGRANGNCNIKGNRNRKGEWIYHVPGMPYYDQTRPEEIFCTEADAQAAGYRRAKVQH